MDGFALALIAVVFGLLAALSAHRYQSWLAPAPLWNVCWAGLFACTALLGYGFNFPPGAVLTLMFLAVSFNLPCFLLNSSIPVVDHSARTEKLQSFAPPTWLLLATAAIGLAGVIKLGSDLGTSVFSLRSLDALFSVGQQNAVAIFRGESNISFVVNFAFAGLQFGTALAGVRVALKPGRAAWLTTVLLFAVSFVWSSITTQRSYLLVPVVWFVAGYLAALVYSGRRTVPARAAVAAVVGGGALLLLIVFLRAVRTDGTNAGFSEATFAPTRLWLAGYVPTFAAWYEQSSQDGLSFGLLNGFEALIRPLVGEKAADTGDSNFYGIGSGLTSNAGTSMMRIVGTGGVAWGFLTVIVLALIAHLAYRRAAIGSPVAAAVYVAVLSFVMWSTNAWFFGYGGRIIALVAIVLAAALAQRLAAGRSRASLARGEISVSPREEGILAVSR